MLDTRKRLRDNAAEGVAQSGDRLKALAARIRPHDKLTALPIQREAEKLHDWARWIEKQAIKRLGERRDAARHAKRSIQPLITPTKPEPKEWWETD